MNRRLILKALIAMPSVLFTVRKSEPAILFADVHKTPELKSQVQVRCNGEVIEHCITADVRRGYCIYFRPKYERGRSRWKRAMMRGSIEIERIG